MPVANIKLFYIKMYLLEIFHFRQSLFALSNMSTMFACRRLYTKTHTIITYVLQALAFVHHYPLKETIKLLYKLVAFR